MTTPTIPNLLTVRQFAERHPAFTEGSLRWLIFQAGSPERDSATTPLADLNTALVRVGRRVLIDEAVFFAWLQGRRVVQ